MVFLKKNLGVSGGSVGTLPPDEHHSKTLNPLSINGPWEYFSFQVIGAIVFTWLFCLVLTVANVLPADPSQGYGYYARTDIKLDALRQANWFRFPYPGGHAQSTLLHLASLLNGDNTQS